MEVKAENLRVQAIKWKNFKGKDLYYIRFRGEREDEDYDINVGETTYNAIVKLMALAEAGNKTATNALKAMTNGDKGQVHNNSNQG